MQITDAAKPQLEAVLEQNSARNLRLYFAGMG